MAELVFPKLSYQLVGAAFRVDNELGWGLVEKQYQQALAAELDAMHMSYTREMPIPLQYRGKKLSTYYADFVVEGDEGKILLEVKVVRTLGYAHTKQVMSYLVSAGLRLGIVLYFTKDGVKYRRVLNPHSRYLEKD